MNITSMAQSLTAQLLAVGTEQKAQASARYFPEPIRSLGALAPDIKNTAQHFHRNNSNLDADDILAISEFLLANADYHEEVMLAFLILDKYVGSSFDDALVDRFKYWLEHYVDNWAQVDNLCMKTIYRFMLTRTHLLPALQQWMYSDVPWCRRAVNVVWLKFIHRKIGKSYYTIPLDLVFENCQKMFADEDVYVQKSIGWLLKVTSTHHPQQVFDFLVQNIQYIDRATLRYAIEKFDQNIRGKVLSLK